MEAVAENRGLRFYKATSTPYWKVEEFICVCTNHYGYTIFQKEASQQSPEDTEPRRQSPYRGHEPR